MDARYNRVEVGDNVTFNARGHLEGGTVTRLRIKERRGRIRQLMEMHGAQDLTMTEVAEVLDRNGKGLWTIAVDKLTVVKRLAQEQTREAVKEVNRLKAARRNAEQYRTDERFATSDTHGLLDIKPGAPIMVLYRGGVKIQRIFQGMTSTGNVKYLQDGRVRFTPPKFVEVVPAAESQQVVA